MTLPTLSDHAAPTSLRVVSVPLSELHSDPANARLHPERNLRAIEDSLREFGQVEPLLVQEGTGKVVGGNGRLEVMRKLGWRTATVTMLPLSAVQASALAIAMNRTGELAEWDQGALDRILTGLAAEQYDLSLLHVDPADVDQLAADLVGKAAAEDNDAMPIEQGWKDVVEIDEPDPPKTPVTQMGDVWILGEHKLLCGDSRQADAVCRLMAGEQADLVATDPPYGVAYKGGMTPRDAIDNDDGKDLSGLLRPAFAAAVGVCRPGAVWYVACPSGPKFLDFASLLFEMEIWRQTLVWVKSSSTFGRSDYHGQFEAIIYGWAPGAAHKPPPDRKQTTVWEFDRPSRSPDHPTTKPTAMYAKMCEMSSLPGQVVFEPFSGSGTTLLACEQTGRRCRAVEISPQYVDVAVRRWEELTGRRGERRPAKA